MTANQIGSYIYQNVGHFSVDYLKSSLSPMERANYFSNSIDEKVPDTEKERFNRLRQCKVCNTECHSVEYGDPRASTTHTYDDDSQLQAREEQVTKFNAYIDRCRQQIKVKLEDNTVSSTEEYYGHHVMGSQRTKLIDWRNYICQNQTCPRFGMTKLQRSCFLLQLKQGNMVDLTSKSVDGSIELIIPSTVWKYEGNLGDVHVLSSVHNNIIHKEE